MNKREQLRLYREQMGDEKAEVQAWRAKYTRTCCGTAKDEPHNPSCRYRNRRRG